MGQLDFVLRRANKFWPAVLVVILSMFCTQSAVLDAQQQMAPTLTVTVNKSMVFRLAERAKRVSVSQSAVADVLVVAPNQLLINGKAVGTTSLIVFNEKGEVANYDLIVTPDVAALRAQLRAVFPDEKINVSTSGPSLVLSGEVSNETVYDRVLEVAATYLPPKPPAGVAPNITTITVNPGKAQVTSSGTGFAGGGQIPFDDTTDPVAINRFPNKGKIEGIVDLLVIKEIRQIELDVIVAEAKMDKFRDIGFNFNYTGPTKIASASTFFGELLGGAATGAFSYVNGAYALTSLYRALQNKEVAEILAQPRLVMQNGRSGGFLSGGEFPVKNATGLTNETTFKPFGVRLDFVPTITWSGRINLRIIPEVSEPQEFAEGTGVTTKRTVSQVELQEGESLIIGGLLDRRILKLINKLPLLGDIPILGALFRSTSFQNRETELIFVITPRIVRAMKPGERPQLPAIEKYDDPDIRQVPLPGSAGPRKSTPSATIP